MTHERTGLEIAVVGMAGRFPGADSVRELWDNLSAGVESINRFTRQELLDAGVEPAVLDDPDYVAARAVLDDIDCFDAGFFGYSAREAQLMDPQHRLFLMAAWSALEDAGRRPRDDGRSIGVFASAGFCGYLMGLHTRRFEPGYFDSAETLIGNEKDHIATRVSYKLNLTGPSMAIQTACSSSLTAVHQACRSLLAGDCDGALAGGVSVAVPQRSGYLWEEGGALSRDGHCRVFDARASGFVPGSGVGVVFLKRLEDAEADRDPIRAVIRGSAVNNDGAAKIGYSAPSVQLQAEAIRAAYRFAELDPATVGYVEAHGTATELGDPIEVEALVRAFGRGEGGLSPCDLGSIKANVGHLDAAAGVAGLIKAVLVLEHREIPPNLHFEEPNPRIPLGDGPFRVPREGRPWTDAVRRAGVSSLGLGGTNVHVVLESYDSVRESRSSPAWSVLPISAHSPASLRGNVARLAECLRQPSAPHLEDVAYTLQVGRTEMPYRCTVVTDCVTRAAEQLEELARSDEPGSEKTPEPDSGEEDSEPLAERAEADTLARRWRSGVEVDWSALSRGGKARRVALPTYSFERARHWVERSRVEPSPVEASPPATSGGRARISSWFYLPGFKPCLRPRPPTVRELAQDDSLWLLVAEDSALVHSLRARLQEAGREVVQLPPAGASDPDHDGYLAGLLEAHATRRVRVLHLAQLGWPEADASGPEAFAESRTRGYDSLLRLARELISSDCEEGHLTILCSGVHNVSGGDALLPERATLLGPCMVLSQEAPHITCRLVDLPLGALEGDGGISSEELVRIALAESWNEAGERLVAYRGAARLSKCWQEVALESVPPGSSRFRSGGNYLVVGGLGPVGRHLAHHLAERYQARLTLLSRTELPPRERWPETIADGGAEAETLGRIEAVQAMEAQGGSVRAMRVDVAEPEQLEACVRAIEREWGPLDGVFHCAAASQDRSASAAISVLDETDSELQFRAKVQGTYNLAHVFADRPLDLCVVFSSNAAVLGGLGMTAYSAANCFVDAFCAVMRARGRPWMSVNWDGWLTEETDDEAARHRPAAGGLRQYALAPAEGLEALERLLATEDIAQWAVSAGDLSSRLRQWLTPQSSAAGPAQQTAPHSLGGRASSSDAGCKPSVGPRNDMEAALVEIWQEVLGVSCGVHDDFFDMGGHSLLAMHLRARIRKRLGRDLPLEAVFRVPTIEGMGQALGGDESAPVYRSVVVLRTSGGNPTFYCVHPASGTAAGYHALCHYLGEDQPFCAFQARGLDDGQPPFRDLDEMVETYLEELEGRQPAGPYYLGGWCAGGTIAYEMAQRLRGRGQEVHLALIDMDQPNATVEEDDTRVVFANARTNARNLGVDLPLHHEELVGRSFEEQLQHVLELYKQCKVAPEDTSFETMKSQWEVFFATLRSTRSYRFEPYDGVLTLFQAAELDYRRAADMEVPATQVAHQMAFGGFRGRAALWAEYSPYPIEVHTVPGYHSVMVMEPHVAELARELRQWIECREKSRR